MTTATQSHTPSLPEPLLVAAANVDPDKFFTLAEVAALVVRTSTRRPVQLQTVRKWCQHGVLRAVKQKMGLRFRYVVRGSELLRFLADQWGNA